MYQISCNEIAETHFNIYVIFAVFVIRNLKYCNYIHIIIKYIICIRVQVDNLKPDTSYVFMVRAENSHGLSVPSALSAMVKTGGTNTIITQQSLEEARERLGTKVIDFKELFPVSSTSVRVMWEVCKAYRLIDVWSTENYNIFILHLHYHLRY
jgi:hypothetical protein